MSLNNYYAYQASEYKKTQDKVYKLDGDVVRQQMRVEAHQRSHIDKARQAQKSEFESDLNKDLQKLEARNTAIVNNKSALG